MVVVSALKAFIKPTHKNNVPDFRSLWTVLMTAINAETSSH